MSYDCCGLTEVVYLKTPIGWLKVEGDHDFVRSISFVTRGAQPKLSASSAVMQAGEELRDYFSGLRREFSFPFLMSGTAFQNIVWGELLKVEFGQTSTYGEIAKAIGKSAASRAVGMANNQNQLPIVIPCHRIIAKTGNLQGYAGGLKRKQWLLNHEASLSYLEATEDKRLGKKYG